jgi:multimeric flavodoxin WrbA
VLVSQEIFRELPVSIVGIIYGPSTYNGTLSTKLKQFVEDANKTMCLDLRWRNKVAAGFTSSGIHGGETLDTFMTMTLFAAQDMMPWMAQAPNSIMIATRKTRTNSTRWATGWIPWRSPTCMDDAPGAIWPDNELRTATHLGQRVAEIARRLV